MEEECSSGDHHKYPELTAAADGDKEAEVCG